MEGVTVIRSGRKTLALEVKPDGRVLLRLPFGCSNSEAESFFESNRAWLERAKIRVAERIEHYTEPTEQECAELKELARKIIPERVKYFSELTGLVPSSVHITSARTRFGSCSGKNSVSFSWRLMKYPSDCIDYVVLHELSHIKHHDHSAKFYALIARYMPDHEARRKKLSEYQK